MDRWFAIEMGGFYKGLAAGSRPLAELLQEERPAVRTRGGEEHFYDRVVLQRFYEALTPLDRRKLRLPITVYVDKDYSSDAAIHDEVAFRLLRALGEIPPDREMRDGRLWLSHVQARALASRYPATFQFLYS